MIKVRTNARTVAVNIKNFSKLNTLPLMRSIAGDLDDIVQTAFEKEADPQTNTPWKPLHPVTIAKRRKKGTWPGKKLQDTGRLIGSITTVATKTKARVGTSMNYGYPNQVTRRYIGVSDSDIAKLKAKMIAFYVKNFGKPKSS